MKCLKQQGIAQTKRRAAKQAVKKKHMDKGEPMMVPPEFKTQKVMKTIWKRGKRAPIISHFIPSAGVNVYVEEKYFKGFRPGRNMVVYLRECIAEIVWDWMEMKEYNKGFKCSWSPCLGRRYLTDLDRLN